VRLAIQPMWRARRATSAAVQPRCCCAIAATGGTTRAAWSQRCLVCLVVIGSAPAVLLRRPRWPPPRLPLPLPTAGPRPQPTMMWPARCVLANPVLPRCCCAMAATGGSTCSSLACAGSARPLGTGTARLVLDPLLTILYRCWPHCWPRREGPWRSRLGQCTNINTNTNTTTNNNNIHVQHQPCGGNCGTG
jgi:hypothetical protein